MAKKNRDEVQTQVDAVLVPTLTLTNHKGLLNNDITESTVFEKDVISSETPIAGNVTIDYSDKDTATVTTTANLTVSFTNLENGAVKHISITKNATNTVSFSGATDVSPRRTLINTSVTAVRYQVANKNGVIFVQAISVDFDFQPDINALDAALTADINALDSSLTALISQVSANQNRAIFEIGEWDMDLDINKFVSYSPLLYASDIKIVSIIIRNNADTEMTQLNASDFAGAQGGFGSILSTGNIKLERVNTGRFDNSLYNATPGYNRGWVTVEYNQ